jgi:signal transduction histidine kinase
MRKQTTLIFYALSAYVLLQFGWWSFLLMKLTEKTGDKDVLVQRQALMIISEGFVFFSILIWGLYKIKSSINQELALGRRQQNFILAVTHELKTPLSGMKLYLQTIRKRTLNADQQTELLDKCLKENKRLELLVENILTVARVEENAYAFVVEKVEVVPFLRELVSMYELLENLEITLHVPADLSVYTDRSAMQIILSNLIDNALKYASYQPKVSISIVEKNDCIEWLVEDNGPGISKENMHRVMQKFVRLENEETRHTKGTGLGLYIVGQFVKRQNGKIALSKSNLGGLKVSILLKSHSNIQT